MMTVILNQIKYMIRLNSARCEQLAHLDGVSIIISLIHTNNFSPILVQILSELINSTKYIRTILKEMNGIEILINFIRNKNFKDYFQDLLSNLLHWLNHDKIYVE